MPSDGNWALVIVVRWLHVISACLLVGATFFVAFLLPAATRELDEASRESVLSRSRWRFKMLVHVCILLLLASGTYNLIGNRSAYRRGLPLTHALLGPHMLLALTAFVILLVVLAGRQPWRAYQRWVRLTAYLLLLTVLTASALKWAREHPRQATTQNRTDN